LFNLLRRNCKDVQNFDHYLDNDIGHRVCWRHFRLGFEAFEEVLYPIEQIRKVFFTCGDVLGSLTVIDDETPPKCDLGDPHQEQNPDASRDHICR
jgi:hypothetical protein